MAKSIKKNTPAKLNISFEEALKKALNTPLSKNSKELPPKDKKKKGGNTPPYAT